MNLPPPDPRTNRTLLTAVDPDNEDATTSTNATPGDHNTGNEIAYDSDGVTRAESTRRLLAKPSREGVTIDTTPSSNNGQLHAIVGQHLVLTPTASMQSADQPRSYSPSALTAASTDRGQFQYGGNNGPAMDVSNNSLGHFNQPSYGTPMSQRIGPLDTEPEKNGSSSIPDSSSYFNLLGADVSNDVYKWHEKENRRQLDRPQTYHAPATADPDISNIKVPGGFRRHFVQQDAATHGAPAPHLTESFIHFLGLFNMYEMDHFAGENFHSIPRRSIVVPRDLEKRRHSLADTVKSNRKVFTPGQVVDEDEVVIEEPEEKISFSKAVGMLFKTFIASGILFLPNAFRNGGILFSSLFMTLIATLCLHSFLLLVKCRELYPGSYGDIGQRFYGRWMRYIVLFAIAISQFGFCCGYCIFFAQQFAIVVDSLGGAHLDKIVWIAIFFVILVPFTLVRNIGKLGFSTLVADVCIIVGLIYLYVYDIKQLVINGGPPTPLRLFNSQDFGLFIGTAVFSYEGIGMVIPICGSMANPKQFPRALTIVLSVVCVLLVSFGAMGYAAYGEPVQTIVLDDLPNATDGEKAGKNAIQLLYIIAIFLTTPLMLFPCIRIIEHMVLRTVRDVPAGKTRILKENIVRILVDFCVAIVAYAGYTKLDIFIAFVGSFACAPLLFIFPPLFHLRAFPSQPLWRKISDIVLILFGFLVFFYTLIVTIQSFSKTEQ